MPSSKRINARTRGSLTKRSPLPKLLSRALLVIDNASLQREAWAEYKAAQKRHDKAARDLHHHEQVDMPAYEAWLHRTFPVMITTLRELHEEVSTKKSQVEHVQTVAVLSGRSPRKVWLEQKESDREPDLFDEEFKNESNGSSSQNDKRHSPGSEDSFDESDEWGNRRSAFDADFESAPVPPETVFTREAKAIYRRLVQLLHPDRGGEFTPMRQRLWHEVQQAWAARDSDWLCRIEVEWESANETLCLTSPLSRLRRAIAELDAARRDTQQKLRRYRKSFPWRFSVSEPKRGELEERAKASFDHDIQFLRRQLAYLNSIIASWETKPRRRSRERYATWQSLY